MKLLNHYLLHALLLTSSILCTSPDIITSLKVVNNTISINADPTFHATYLKDNFFVEYEAHINLNSLDFSLLTIPFVMNIIPIIWISENTYSIDEMDEDLYHSLNTIQKIFQAFYPSKKWSGKLIPKKLVKHTVASKSNHVATLFSGGLDATQTALHNHDKQQLLITICGGDIGLNKQKMWENVQKQCKKFGALNGHTNAFVRSNFNIFRNFHYLRQLTPELHGNWFAWTSQSLGYTSLAAPLAYLDGCSHILIASTRTSDNPFPYGTHPVIDNNITMAGIMVDHDSPHFNRIEKIKDIITICKKYNRQTPFLRVCWGKDPAGGNCKTCEKCFRTIVELMVELQNPQDYGFTVSLDEAMALAQNNIPGKSTLDAGLMWHWKCIQEAAQKKIMCNALAVTTPQLQEFIKRIAALDLNQYKRPSSKQKTSKEKEAFAQLWHKAANRTFTLEDLNILNNHQQKNGVSHETESLSV